MLLRAYRRAGAELPFADPARERCSGLEGWFWRFTHPGGRVTIVLHGRSRDRAGAWSLVAVARQPGGVSWAIGDDLIDAGPGRLRVALPDDAFEATWAPTRPWDRRSWGALGPAQVVPGLGQYWHPHLLLGTAPDGTTVYAEKNWGSRFAGHWWWGQAHGFGDSEVCAAFAGGRMLGRAPTAVVVALEDRLYVRSPPLHRVVTSTARNAWRVRAGALELEAEADAPPHVLPVPVPGERRAVLRSRQHLVGRMAVVVRRRGGIVFRGESELAGLERGTP